MKDTNLFKSFGVLWKSFRRQNGELSLENSPFCPTDGCRTELGSTGQGWYCLHCKKYYPYINSTCSEDQKQSILKLQGFEIKDWEVYSLDLPPTKISARDSDNNYWIEARITEKAGRKLGVVYFGEKKGAQKTKDYSQFFIELEKEEIRFDINNQHPSDLLAKLTVEFKKTIIEQKTKEEL
jgi:hypothetical protein